MGTIRRCDDADLARIHDIINDAATAYRGVIPDDCYHEPYMPWDELSAEAQTMTFYGYETGVGAAREPPLLVGVMALEKVRDVTLIRHAYVTTAHQRRGIGEALLRHVMGVVGTRRLLVGTWADAWSIRFWRKQGFVLLPDKDALLRTYWPRIPQRQVEASVVLGMVVEQP